MTPDFPAIEKRFRKWVATFFTGDSEHDYHIDLKFRHSLRVHGLAERVLRAEGVPPDVAESIRIAALLHDAGRFIQYRRYGSFHDPSTANHARLGVHALIAHGLLDGLPSSHRRTVLGAVFLHNVRTLPAALREPLDTVVKLVRDCDKLDIVPVVLEHLDENNGSNSSVVTMGITPDPVRYTRSVYDQVYAGETAKYQEMRWSHDFRLLILGWFYDLNFASSAAIYAERGYAETIFDAFPEDAPLQRLRRRMEADMGQRRKVPLSGLDSVHPQG